MKNLKLLLLLFIISISCYSQSFVNVSDTDDNNVTWKFNRFSLIDGGEILKNEPVNALLIFKKDKNEFILDLDYTSRSGNLTYYTVLEHYTKDGELTIKAYEKDRKLIYVFTIYDEGIVIINRPNSSIFSCFGNKQ
jgi:hypothetical protein